MNKCALCGDIFGKRRHNNKKYGKICDKCYQREKANSKIYDKPQIGEITYNEKGYPICHICGKAYKKVLSHAYHTHGILAYDYKIEFGLETSKGVLSEESRNLILENNTGVNIDKMIEAGKDTRFKKGYKGRTRDMVSPQTRKALIERLQIINQNKKQAQ